MSRKQRKILKLFNKGIFGFLGLLSFSSCESFTTEYGMPNANYKLNINVLSQTESKAIKGIQAKYTIIENNTVYSEDMAFSDENGQFSIELQGVFPSDYTFGIELTDVDGEENGSYQAREYSVVLTSSELQGGDGDWFHGSVERDVDIHLEEDVQ